MYYAHVGLRPQHGALNFGDVWVGGTGIFQIRSTLRLSDVRSIRSQLLASDKKYREVCDTTRSHYKGLDVQKDTVG